jgi:hypothetical protein
MASPINAVLCALIGAAFWSVLGYAIVRHLLPRVLALGVAPILGWAVFSAASLPIIALVGFSAHAVVSLAAFALAAAAILMLRAPEAIEWGVQIRQRPGGSAVAAGLVVALAVALAFALAVVPALALLPKYSAEGVHLAAPIFDHAKIAIIDAMTRQGLPPVNPVFGGPAEAGRLAYYYLWHFSAAELALPLVGPFKVSGWEADIALTWFTAFASLMVMMAAAVWLTQRADAAMLVVVLAASASLRAVLGSVFGDDQLEPFLQASTGFAGWLFQSAWVPQHLMAASCTVAAMLLLAHYAKEPRVATLVLLAVVVAAAFESSAFVGGVTFAVAAILAAPFLVAAIATKQRLAAVIGLVACVLSALCIAAPFLHDQLATVARHPGAIALHPFEVLGAMFAPALRRWLDLPAYWLILLPLEFPASFVPGVLALMALSRSATGDTRKTALQMLSALAAAGLLIPWLFASTLGDNNDLALRAILPAAMVLIVAAAGGVLLVSSRAMRAAIVASACGGLVLSLPGTSGLIGGNLRGNAAADAAVFARTPDLWSAVRRYASPNARIANNPLFLQDLTPWPVNISWALLADRSSCFAGREMALPFAPLSPQSRETVNDQFVRVFAGGALPDDVGDFATKYGCDIVVAVPQDGAWKNDPFAASADYRLAESRDGGWRIYVRTR